VPIVDVRFPSGARTECVIEAGALRRLPELCTAAGLTGTTGWMCDSRL